MPPIVAALLTIAFIIFLFRRDIRERPNVTGALWLPVIWMFLVASRPVSKWLAIFDLPGFVATSVEEGSPLDALVFLALIAAGFYVLNKRRVSLSEVIRDNRWLTVFVLYCFLAIFWSDFPFVSFKRWIKILGDPIMVLILLTEPDPEEALLRLMKRCAYVIFPVSILWMKYYPNLGRTASEWGGMGNCGIAGDKNQLGAICFIFGLFFVWHFLHVRRMEKGTPKRDELRLTGFLLWMIGYCLWKAHSATSQICLLLGVAVIMLLGLRSINKKTIVAYAIGGVFLLMVAQLMFDIYGMVINLTGRESTIYSRGLLWETVLRADTNPIFGAGFEGFWLGKRVDDIWAMPEFWWHPNQAHNGYLEIYLNLGIVGLGIFAGVAVAVFRKIRADLLRNFEWGRFQMACLVGILAHNWTEAGFKGLSFPFLMFFVIAVRYAPSRLNFARVDELTEAGSREAQAKLAYGRGLA